jgi:hypothetical protein
MLSFDDERWLDLKGGYRMLFDPRPCLANIESGHEADLAWRKLWEDLYHQGDVGEASYAAVPHLVRICRRRGGTTWSSWNVCALIGVIEFARRDSRNPEIPEWCGQDYFDALAALGVMAAADILQTSDKDAIRALLCIIALAKSLPIHARFFLDYSEEEMGDMEQKVDF